MATETERIRNLLIVAKQTLIEVQKSIGNARRDALIIDLATHLRDIDEANEARDKSRTLSGVTATIQLPEMPKEICQGLLEIGCDVGIAEAAQVFGGSPSEIARVLNPFRRASTTILESKQCSRCKHPLAADRRCAIACGCTACDRRGCDCRADDVEQGIHFNECMPDRPWKKGPR